MLHKEESKFDKDWDDFAEGLRRAIEASLVIKTDKNTRIRILISILQNNGCRNLV